MSRTCIPKIIRLTLGWFVPSILKIFNQGRLRLLLHVPACSSYSEYGFRLFLEMPHHCWPVSSQPMIQLVQMMSIIEILSMYITTCFSTVYSDVSLIPSLTRWCHDFHKKSTLTSGFWIFSPTFIAIDSSRFVGGWGFNPLSEASQPPSSQWPPTGLVKMTQKCIADPLRFYHKSSTGNRYNYNYYWQLTIDYWL